MKAIMHTDRRGIRDSITSAMHAMLASVNWQQTHSTVLEIRRRLSDAVTRNEESLVKLHRHMLRVSFSARALAKRQPSNLMGKTEWTWPVSHLLAQAEPLASLSTTHLSKTTRNKLAADALSVASYPNRYGGFVYVGGEAGDMPKEADLFAIAEVARLANLVWLKFDCDAAVIEGLPVFVE